MTDRNGNIMRYEYDRSRLLLRIIDPLEFETRFVYDMAGRVVQMTDAGGLITQLVLDGNDNVIQQRETGDGRTVSMFWAFDRDQRPIRWADRNGNRFEFVYDLANRLISVETLDVPAWYIVKDEFEYDLNGNIIRHRDPRNGDSFFTYDFAGNVLTHMNQLGHIENYTLDANFNLIEVRDRLGNSTRFTYDGLNRLTSEVRPEGETIRFVYDAFHNLVEVRQLLAGGNYGITRFNVGPLGNPISETTQLGAVTSFATDRMGNVIRQVDPDGNTNDFEFDARNMLSIARYAGHEPKYFFYDGMGNIVETREEMGTSLFTFDAWNRLTSATDHRGDQVQYFYDNNGNTVRMIYPDGREVLRTFDHMNRMISITVDGEAKVYRYNPKGELIERRYPSGRITTYAFNHAGLLTEARELDRYGRTIRQTTFAYRDNGLLWSETRTGIDTGLREEVKLFYFLDYTLNRHYNYLGSNIFFNCLLKASLGMVWVLRNKTL